MASVFEQVRSRLRSPYQALDWNGTTRPLLLAAGIRVAVSIAAATVDWLARTEGTEPLIGEDLGRLTWATVTVLVLVGWSCRRRLHLGRLLPAIMAMGVLLSVLVSGTRSTFSELLFDCAWWLSALIVGTVGGQVVRRLFRREPVPDDSRTSVADEDASSASA